MSAIGCPDEKVEILFVQPTLSDEDIQFKRVMASEARFKVLDAAMRNAGFGDTWVADRAQFTVPVRCGAKPQKKHKDHCRDLLWVGDILRKKPKLIVTLGGVNIRVNNKKVKVDAFGELFGKGKSPGRGRVYTLREVLGTDKFKLNATAVPAPNEVTIDGEDITGADCYIDVPEDIYVMDVTSLDECLLDPGMREFLYHDIAKIPKILSGTYVRKTNFEGRQYRLVETFEEAIEVFKYLATLDRFAYDIETGPHPYAFDPYSKDSKILCVAFSDPWRRSWCIPWAHKDSPLKNHVDDMAKWFGWVVAHRKKIDTWNGKFDNRWFKVKHGIHITSHRDGMLDRGLLDENKDKKLKTWAEMHTDLGYYDEELQDYFVDAKGKPVPASKKCYEKHVPLDVLMRYNCADADATMVLTLRYEQELYEKGLLGYSQVFTMEDVESTALTEHEGVAIDLAHREVTAADVKQKLEAVIAAIQADPSVQNFAVVRAAEEMKRKKLFYLDGYIYSDYQAYLRGDNPLYSEQHQAGWVPETVQSLIDKKVIVLRKVGEEVVDGKTKPVRKYVLPKSRRYTLADIALNLASPNDLKEFIYGKAHLALPVKSRTDSDQPSTDEGVLKNNAAQYPILGHINDYRKLMKWKSTYLDPVCNGVYVTVNTKGKEVEKVGWIRDDGLVHAEFLLTGNDKGQEQSSSASGTVTGRKSCVEPNLQNQKSRGEGAKEIKKYFVSKYVDVEPHHAGPFQLERFTLFAKDGSMETIELPKRRGLILQADYSQLELRVFAVCSKIAWMIGRYQNDADLHAELATELFQITMDEAYANGGFWRACAKEFWFGPIYGEGAQGIVDQLKKRHKIIWTKQQGEEALQRMYDRMPEFDAYKQEQIDLLRRLGEVRTVFGRRRFLPTFFSTEKWMIARAIRQAINFLIQSAGSDMTTYSWIILNWWARLVGIKSRIVISVHDSLVWDVWPGEEFLVCAATKMAMENLPFSFVKTSPIPFKTELEIGLSWGEMKGTEKIEEFKQVDLDHFMDARLDPLRERCATVLF